MKLSESSIRNYIRRLIMETFYVSPQGDIYGGGDVMDKDQMEKQDPDFFANPRSVKYPYTHRVLKCCQLLIKSIVGI